MSYLEKVLKVEFKKMIDLHEIQQLALSLINQGNKLIAECQSSAKITAYKDRQNIYTSGNLKIAQLFRIYPTNYDIIRRNKSH